jgi:hypothetical protein
VSQWAFFAHRFYNLLFFFNIKNEFSSGRLFAYHLQTQEKTMKISTEQLQLLAREQAKKGQGTNEGAGFNDLLAKEMKGDSTTAASTAKQTAVPHAGILGLNPLFATQQVNPSIDQQEIMNTMDGVLDQLDQYAKKLGSSDVNLRNVYQELQGIGQQMDRLRETMQSQGTSSPELDALYTEMDILATTETFKFNRGDYFAG